MSKRSDIRVQRYRDRHYRLQGGRCAYCGRRMLQPGEPGEKRARVTLDHVLPRALGGRHTMANTVAACLRCNGKKGSDIWIPVHAPQWLGNTPPDPAGPTLHEALEAARRLYEGDGDSFL